MPDCRIWRWVPSSAVDQKPVFVVLDDLGRQPAPRRRSRSRGAEKYDFKQKCTSLINDFGQPGNPEASREMPTYCTLRLTGGFPGIPTVA